MARRPGKRPALPEQLVTHPAQLSACLAHLAKAPLVGFDTEFVGEDAYRPELCLVQVSTAEQLFVIDPFECGPLDGFWELLHDPARVVMVHAGREEIRMCRFGSGKPPANLFDVQVAAALVGLQYPIGYAGLVQELLGVRMTKGETLTDWRRRPLSEAQTRYAFDDVRFLLPAWDRLHKKLTSLHRLGWAADEFAAPALVGVEGHDPVDAVVRGRDAVEHVADGCCFFIRWREDGHGHIHTRFRAYGLCAGRAEGRYPTRSAILRGLKTRVRRKLTRLMMRAPQNAGQKPSMANWMLSNLPAIQAVRARSAVLMRTRKKPRVKTSAGSDPKTRSGFR